MTEWQEFHGKRRTNYTASGPKSAPFVEPAAPVVVGNITYRPLTRYEIIFEIQPDPRDVRIAELEQQLEAAYGRIDRLEEIQRWRKITNTVEMQP